MICECASIINRKAIHSPDCAESVLRALIQEMRTQVSKTELQLLLNKFRHILHSYWAFSVCSDNGWTVTEDTPIPGTNLTPDRIVYSDEGMVAYDYTVTSNPQLAYKGKANKYRAHVSKFYMVPYCIFGSSLVYFDQANIIWGDGCDRFDKFLQSVKKWYDIWGRSLELDLGQVDQVLAFEPVRTMLRLKPRKFDNRYLPKLQRGMQSINPDFYYHVFIDEKYFILEQHDWGYKGSELIDYYNQGLDSLFIHIGYCEIIPISEEESCQTDLDGIHEGLRMRLMGYVKSIDFYSNSELFDAQTLLDKEWPVLPRLALMDSSKITSVQYATILRLSTTPLGLPREWSMFPLPTDASLELYSYMNRPLKSSTKTRWLDYCDEELEQAFIVKQTLRVALQRAKK